MRRYLLLAAVALVGSIANDVFAQGRCMGGGGTGTGTGVTTTGVTGTGTGLVGTGLVGTGVSPAAMYHLAAQQVMMQQMMIAQQQAYLREEAAYAEQLAEKKERKLAVLRARRERETASWTSTGKSPASSYRSLGTKSDEGRLYKVSSSARQATTAADLR